MAAPCTLCCSEDFRSAKLDSSAQRLVLFCTSCRKSREIRDQAEHEALTSKHGRPFAKERIKASHQVGFCDLIQFEEEGRSVFGVCTEIDRFSNMLAIVARSQHKENAGRGAKRNVSLTELVEKDAFVFRYMPLDWLPLNEVLHRARRSLGETTEQRPEEFANWLKTGRKEQISLSCKDVTQACPNCASALDRSSFEGRTPDGRLSLLCADCGRGFELPDRPGQWSHLGHVRLEPPAPKGIPSGALVFAGIVGGASMTPVLLSDFLLLTRALRHAMPPALPLPPGTGQAPTAAAWGWMSSWADHILPSAHESVPFISAFQVD